MLGFKCNGGTILDRFAIDCRPAGSIEEVPSVNLDARLVGKHLNLTTGSLVPHGAGRLGIAFRLTVNHPVVIIATGIFKLLVVIVDSLSDSGRSTEVKRGSLDARIFPKRNAERINRRVGAGIHVHDIVENGSVCIALEMEERVIGDVHRSIVVCGCHIVDSKLIIAVH